MLANLARAIESELTQQGLAVKRGQSDADSLGGSKDAAAGVMRDLPWLDPADLIDDEQGAIKKARIMAKHLRGSGFEDLARRPKWDLADVSIWFADRFLKAVLKTLTRVASLRRTDEVRKSRRGRMHHHFQVDPGQRVKYEPIVDREDFAVGTDDTLCPVGTYPAVREEMRFRDALVHESISHVRRCQNEGCLNLFWAGRSDQPCCSKTCNNARSQRQWYRAHKDDKKYRTYVREREKSNGGK